MTRVQLLPEILKLSVEDQMLIAEAIRAHLGGEWRVDEEGFKAELDRRIAEAERHPEEEVSWEELSKELEGYED